MPIFNCLQCGKSLATNVAHLTKLCSRCYELWNPMERKTMYIAVLVCKPENLGAGVQHPCAITGSDKDHVIAKALQTRETWRKTHQGPYSIFVGTLTEEVVVPVEYNLRKI